MILSVKIYKISHKKELKGGLNLDLNIYILNQFLAWCAWKE